WAAREGSSQLVVGPTATASVSGETSPMAHDRWLTSPAGELSSPGPWGPLAIWLNHQRSGRVISGTFADVGATTEVLVLVDVADPTGEVLGSGGLLLCARLADCAVQADTVTRTTSP